MAHIKGSIKKRIQDMSLEEQIEALGYEPVFQDLLKEVQQLSPDRRDSLKKELDSLGDTL
ncbi:MAG: hypothetical protein ACLQO6_02835 [Desulfomonilaceae bacterium]